MNTTTRKRISAFWKDRKNAPGTRKSDVAALAATTLASSTSGTRKNSATDSAFQSDTTEEAIFDPSSKEPISSSLIISAASTTSTPTESVSDSIGSCDDISRCSTVDDSTTTPRNVLHSTHVVHEVLGKMDTKRVSKATQVDAAATAASTSSSSGASADGSSAAGSTDVTASTYSSTSSSAASETRQRLYRFGKKFKEIMVPKNRQHLENFRRHFQSDIPGESLITSYSCSHRLRGPAPRDFQPSGRLYVTVSSLAYHSNLFGENRIVLALADVVGVERGQAAESIRIRTSEGVVHGFYGLKAREKVYAMILRLWKTSSSTTSLPALRDTDFLLETSDHDLTPQQDSNVMAGALFPEEQPVASDTVSETSAASRNSDYELPSCPCDDHQGRPLLEHEYQLPAEHIFRLLFTTNPWLRRFFEQSKRSGLETTEWAADEDGSKSRTCGYRMELTQSFGPKSTMINERQVSTQFARKCGRGFVITKEVNNSGVPYADSFSVHIKYCIIPVAERTCLLRVHGDIVFKKSILGMIRGYIERSTIAGVEAYYETLRAALTDEAQRQRRRSRGSESFRGAAQDGYESDEEFDAEFEEPIGASVNAAKDTTTTSRKRTMDRTTSFGDGHLRSISTVCRRQEPPSSHLERHTRLLESINFSLRVVIVLLVAWILLSLYASYRTTPLAAETCRSAEAFPSQMVRSEQYTEDLGDLRQKLADIDEKLSTWQQRP